jgi:small subunit ribosomal protein S1
MNSAKSDDAWNEVKLRLPVGSAVNGNVVHVTQFGVFVDLSVGFSGLLRVTEMAGIGPRKIEDYPQVGEPVTARVLTHDDGNRQVVLI